MTREAKRKYHFGALLQQRADSYERTRLELHAALDRFEHGQLIHTPRGSKLTLRNLALEAGGKSKDTPLSRYPKNHPRAGEYRFPDIVERYHKLKARKNLRQFNVDPKDEKIQELYQMIKSQKEDNVLLARSNNELDAENYELKRRNKELEEQLGKLRKEGLKVIKFDIKR